MTEVEQAIENLLSVIKQTNEYEDFRYQLDKINLQPELHRQIDEFRKENFELQNNTPEDQMLQKSEEFEERYQTFRENPLVNDFLTAETAFCRRMQEINLKITEGLQFE